MTFFFHWKKQTSDSFIMVQMSSDRCQNDRTNLYLKIQWHEKLFSTWLLSEKVIFVKTHFSYLAGFYAPKYQVFQISATSLRQTASKTTFFFFCFLASQDIVWNIVCTNYERLTTQRTCCANEIAPQGICKKNKLKPKPKQKQKKKLLKTGIFFADKKKNASEAATCKIISLQRSLALKIFLKFILHIHIMHQLCIW